MVVRESLVEIIVCVSFCLFFFVGYSLLLSSGMTEVKNQPKLTLKEKIKELTIIELIFIPIYYPAMILVFVLPYHFGTFLKGKIIPRVSNVMNYKPFK